MTAPLILASTSRWRKDLLARLKLPFRCVGSGIDEEKWSEGVRYPEQVAIALARAKAVTVLAHEQDAVVIGSDQVVALGDRCLGKPATPERAVEQLLELAGRTHRLLTAVAIVRIGGMVEWLDDTVMTMRPLTRAEAERYVAADSPLDCAGSYRIESLGIALFERIASDDATAIVGLPLLRTSAELRRLGFPIP
ncbi:MAG: septum formation protein Maf [Planctomycetes bacterium]|nr:septum formation protein Maf [Planctomycetota bacterium]